MRIKTESKFSFFIFLLFLIFGLRNICDGQVTAQEKEWVKCKNKPKTKFGWSYESERHKKYLPIINFKIQVESWNLNCTGYHYVEGPLVESAGPDEQHKVRAKFYDYMRLLINGETMNYDSSSGFKKDEVVIVKGNFDQMENDGSVGIVLKEIKSADFNFNKNLTPEKTLSPGYLGFQEKLPIDKIFRYTFHLKPGYSGNQVEWNTFIKSFNQAYSLYEKGDEKSLLEAKQILADLRTTSLTPHLFHILSYLDGWVGSKRMDIAKDRDSKVDAGQEFGSILSASSSPLDSDGPDGATRNQIGDYSNKFTEDFIIYQNEITNNGQVQKK